MVTENPTSASSAWGERSGRFFERIGLSRIAAGVLLIVLGVLVLVFPELIRWTLGLGAIVIGVLVLAATESPTHS